MKLCLVLLLMLMDGVTKGGATSVSMGDAGRIQSFNDDSRPPGRDVPRDFFCHSCKEVARRAENFFNNASLYDEVDTFSEQVCHIMHFDLRIQCGRLLKMHLREGVTLLQLFFLEENLCSSTGFCRVHASPTDRKKLDSSVEPEFLSLGEIEKELESMSHNGIDGPLQEMRRPEIRAAGEKYLWVRKMKSNRCKGTDA